MEKIDFSASRIATAHHEAGQAMLAWRYGLLGSGEVSVDNIGLGECSVDGLPDWRDQSILEQPAGPPANIVQLVEIILAGPLAECRWERR